MTKLDTPEDDIVSIPGGRWILPALGGLMFIFTLLNGVPWISKAEFATLREVDWAAQRELNMRTERQLDAIRATQREYDTRLRELERGRRETTR